MHGSESMEWLPAKQCKYIDVNVALMYHQLLSKLLNSTIQILKRRQN